jgi:hypothetical protein
MIRVLWYLLQIIIKNVAIVAKTAACIALLDLKGSRFDFR